MRIGGTRERYEVADALERNILSRSGGHIKSVSQWCRFDKVFSRGCVRKSRCKSLLLTRVLVRARLAFMTLKAWMKSTSTTQEQLAEKTGIQQPLISKYLRGVQRPQLDNAIAIEKATEGKVPVEIWATSSRGQS